MSPCKHCTGCQCTAGATTSLIACGADTGAVGLWSVRRSGDHFQLTKHCEETAHDRLVSCLAPLHVGGGAFASGGWDGAVLLWSGAGSRLAGTARLAAHSAQVNALACAPAAPQQLLSASHDRCVRLHDCRAPPAGAGAPPGAAPTLVLSQPATSVFWLDAHRFAAGTAAGAVCLADARQLSSSGSSSSAVVSTATVHGDAVTALRAIDGSRFASVSDDGCACVLTASSAGLAIAWQAPPQTAYLKSLAVWAGKPAGDSPDLWIGGSDGALSCYSKWGL